MNHRHISWDESYNTTYYTSVTLRFLLCSCLLSSVFIHHTTGYLGQMEWGAVIAFGWEWAWLFWENFHKFTSLYDVSILISVIIRVCTMKYREGFAELHFVVVISWVPSHQILFGIFLRLPSLALGQLPQCQWSNPQEYGILNIPNPTKPNKSQTMYISLLGCIIQYYLLHFCYSQIPSIFWSPEFCLHPSYRRLSGPDGMGGSYWIWMGMGTAFQRNFS